MPAHLIFYMTFDDYLLMLFDPPLAAYPLFVSKCQHILANLFLLLLRVFLVFSNLIFLFEASNIVLHAIPKS